MRSSTWPSAERISDRRAIALLAQRADHGQAVALGQHPVDHEHVVVAAVGHRQALLAVAGEIGDMADFTERLDQIVGGLAVVFDDQQAHLRGSCGHGEHAFSHHGAVALHMQGDRPCSIWIMLK